MREGKVFEAYSDESGINVGDRYTSVSVVSGEAEALNYLRDKLRETLRDKNVDEVKFSKITRYERPVTKAAVDFIGCVVNDSVIYNRVRIDTMTTDNECLNGEDYDYVSEPDLEGMYYHVLSNVGRAWGCTEWGFYPDENPRVNWSEWGSSLSRTSTLTGEEGEKLFIDGSDEDSQFEFSEVKELNSVEEPLIQLADLFCGIARFLHEDNGECAEWVERSRKCRYRLIGELYSICNRHGLYVSLTGENDLRVWGAQSPINFWDYRRTY